MEKEVERHMGVEEGLEKERKATVTPIQTVEPGKRRFLWGMCFKCRAACHYSESCTATICERCGGRGH